MVRKWAAICAAHGLMEARAKALWRAGLKACRRQSRSRHGPLEASGAGRATHDLMLCFSRCKASRRRLARPSSSLRSPACLAASRHASSTSPCSCRTRCSARSARCSACLARLKACMARACGGIPGAHRAAGSVTCRRGSAPSASVMCTSAASCGSWPSRPPGQPPPASPARRTGPDRPGRGPTALKSAGARRDKLVEHLRVLQQQLSMQETLLPRRHPGDMLNLFLYVPHAPLGVRTNGPAAAPDAQDSQLEGRGIASADEVEKLLGDPASHARVGDIQCAAAASVPVVAGHPAAHLRQREVPREAAKAAEPARDKAPTRHGSCAYLAGNSNFATGGRWNCTLA
mmetsp:Transcript_30893/g.91802  ORF Transcript_30893/g.91802 Transcript_30893/m.91802 type:complete len:345 (+) Transcript_30893:98-1132(+)